MLLSRVVSQVGDFVQIDRRHYNSVTMRIISGVVPGVSRLARLQELSRKARQRLKWFDYYNSHAHNARFTCRYFGISPQTFYRWKRHYNPHRLESRMPFPVGAIQVDGRAEFEGIFTFPKLLSSLQRWNQEYFYGILKWVKCSILKYGFPVRTRV